MPRLDSENRVYSDTEIQSILKRATELQEKSRPAESPVGLNLTELEQVAEGIGLDKQLLRQAASELEQENENSKPVLAGIPRSGVSTTVFRGDLSEENWEVLVSQMRKSFNVTGQTEHLANTREWFDGRDFIRLSAREENGLVNLRLEYRYERPLLAGFIVLFIWLIAGTGMTIEFLHLDPLVETAIVGGGMACLVAAVHASIRAALSRHKAKLDALLSKTAQRLAGVTSGYKQEKSSAGADHAAEPFDLLESCQDELPVTSADRLRTR